MVYTILQTFNTPLDYLLSSIFSAPILTDETTGKLTTHNRTKQPFVPSSPTACVLCPNEFPYDVPANTCHSVCWYPCQSKPSQWTSFNISNDIDASLSKRLGHCNFVRAVRSFKEIRTPRPSPLAPYLLQIYYLPITGPPPTSTHSFFLLRLTNLRAVC